jgi:hypothetical protein
MNSYIFIYILCNIVCLIKLFINIFFLTFFPAFAVASIHDILEMDTTFIVTTAYNNRIGINEYPVIGQHPVRPKMTFRFLPTSLFTQIF